MGIVVAIFLSANVAAVLSGLATPDWKGLFLDTALICVVYAIGRIDGKELRRHEGSTGGRG